MEKLQTWLPVDRVLLSGSLTKLPSSKMKFKEFNDASLQRIRVQGQYARETAGRLKAPAYGEKATASESSLASATFSSSLNRSTSPKALKTSPER